MCLKHRAQVGATWLLLLSLMIGLFLFGCDESPVGPLPIDEEPTDYRVWYTDDDKDRVLFAYHTATGEIDHAYINVTATGPITVSHDGDLIYVPYGQVVNVYRPPSEQPVGEIPFPANKRVIVSPDGQFVAVPGDSLVIVETTDYSNVVFHADVELDRGHFSVDSRTLYAIGWRSDSGGVFTIPLSGTEDDIQFKEFHEFAWFSQLIVTPDETKWLLYTGSAFAVYDVALDSLIFIEGITPGRGTIAMTPDGKYAFYSNPGRRIWNWEPAGVSEIVMFDVETNQIIERIATVRFIDSVTPWWAPIDEMVVTPDGLSLVGANISGNALVQVDVLERKSSKYVDLRYMYGYVSNLTIQLTK